MFWRVMQFAAALLLLVQNAPARARNFSVNDLLHSENIGAVSFDPSGRWLVFQRLAPFVDMSRFDMIGRARELRSQLYRVDLDAPWHTVPLLPGSRPGTVAYGFSPSGDRLAVGHLSGDKWQLGIVTMSNGAVRWFDLAPDYSPFHTSVRWVSDRRIIAIVDPNGKRPWWLRTDSLPTDTLPTRWAATRSGSTPAVTAIGSGRFRSVDEIAPENRLMLVDAISGETRTLASGHFLSMALGPDRLHIALIEQGPTASLPLDRPVSQIDWPFRRLLSIYDLGIRAGTAMGSAASTAYRLGQETSGTTSIGAGLGGMANAAKGAASSKLRNAFGLRAAAERGQQAAFAAGGTSSGGPAAGNAEPSGAMPAWARKLHTKQASRHRRQMAVHAIRDGDRGGAGATPDIKEKE